ncbi:Imm50 family immunity protein [Herbaspirillum sp. NPDC087042]|uniref:Imm50 family immunity protein n=1 Tax=Herbaspirillum sp. NPDC087042 TaxID=3364004 RepID=UPI00380E2BFE
MDIADFIGGSERLVAELGEWPSFHDDEVVALLLKREAGLNAEEKPSMRLSIHVRRYEPIGLGTAQYHLRMNKNMLVHLVFLGIQDLAISDFNGQNVIHSIEIAVDSMSDTLEASVRIESSWGLEGSFRCKSIQVDSMEMLPNADDH